ncbi:hypothetical protein [Hyphomicrobium sp. ghe19]|nr:hypothetical protein HYPP_01503 [Hyphomicrobium sp. ghe19]
MSEKALKYRDQSEEGEGSMTIGDFLAKHPGWTTLWVIIIAAAIAR